MNFVYERSPANVTVSRRLARLLSATDETLEALEDARKRAVHSIAEDREKRAAAERDRDELRSAARNARNRGQR